MEYILTNEAIKLKINKSKLIHYYPFREIDKYIIE